MTRINVVPPSECRSHHPVQDANMTKAYEITTWAGKKHVVFGDTFRDAMMYNNKLGLDEVKSSKEVDIKTVKTANIDITA